MIPYSYISVQCPHCNTLVSANLEDSHESFERWIDREANITVNIHRCPNVACHGPIIEIVEVINKEEETICLYPYSQTLPPEHVPEKVAREYVSAMNCWEIDEIKAAAVMFRCCLEEMTKDLGGDGKHLESSIKQVIEKHDRLKSVASELDAVRLIGNDAVHRNSYTESDLESAKAFLDLVFQLQYVAGAKMKEYQDRKAQQKSDK